MIHITASDVLKWNDISDAKNKKVRNIQETQDRLTTALKHLLDETKSYLLDGHFCLFNSTGKIEKVPIETFEKITPKLIAVVTTDISVVKRRLENRDKEKYDFHLLQSMQIEEKKYAQQISSTLKIPFIEIQDGNYEPLIDSIS